MKNGKISHEQFPFETLKNANLDVTPDEKAVNVYLFRGATCSHCLDAVAFFAKINEEYGTNFNLKTYEIWNNEDNSDLAVRAARKVGVNELSGVPFIIVGNQYWSGYTDSIGDQIVAAIMDEYEKTDRYDVMVKLEEGISETVVIIVTLIITAAIIAGLIFARKSAK